jgi:hypothetical protein
VYAFLITLIASAHYAKMMYNEVVPQPMDGSPPLVNYGQFRSLLVPTVAQKKNLTSDQLMSKLAHYEEHAHPEKYKQMEVSTIGTP